MVQVSRQRVFRSQMPRTSVYVCVSATWVSARRSPRRCSAPARKGSSQERSLPRAIWDGDVHVLCPHRRSTTQGAWAASLTGQREHRGLSEPAWCSGVRQLQLRRLQMRIRTPSLQPKPSRTTVRQRSRVSLGSPDASVAPSCPTCRGV